MQSLCRFEKEFWREVASAGVVFFCSRKGLCQGSDEGSRDERRTSRINPPSRHVTRTNDKNLFPYLSSDNTRRFMATLPTAPPATRADRDFHFDDECSDSDSQRSFSFGDLVRPPSVWQSPKAAGRGDDETEEVRPKPMMKKERKRTQRRRDIMRHVQRLPLSAMQAIAQVCEEYGFRCPSFDSLPRTSPVMVLPQVVNDEIRTLRSTVEQQSEEIRYLRRLIQSSPIPLASPAPAATSVSNNHRGIVPNARPPQRQFPFRGQRGFDCANVGAASHRGEPKLSCGSLSLSGPLRLASVTSEEVHCEVSHVSLSRDGLGSSDFCRYDDFLSVCGNEGADADVCAVDHCDSGFYTP